MSKLDSIQHYNTNNLLNNKQLMDKFRFHKTFKVPEQVDRLSLIFKHVVTDQRFKKTLNFQQQKIKNSSSFDVRRLDYQHSSKMFVHKLSRSLDDTTRDSINSFSRVVTRSSLSEKSLDEDYERELNQIDRAAKLATPTKA